jgi:outer membrane usher protein
VKNYAQFSRRLSKMRPIPLLISIWLGVASVAVGQTVVPAVGASVDRVLPLEIVVNGSKTGTWLLVERAGLLYAPKEAFDEWRVLLRPNTQSLRYKDKEYYPMASVPGFAASIDYSNQSIDVKFSPLAFTATRLENEQFNQAVVTNVLPSVFLNYDLNYATSILRNAPTLKDLGILSELGASNEWGVLTTSQAGRNLTNDESLGGKRSWVRLETTYTKDFPKDNLTLRLGDTSTRASLWGRSVYFGGLQYGTNFGLKPGFVSQPLPVINGLSAAPSTVEMYVNDVLRQTSNVPTGPFTIDNFSQLTGGGVARLVVRDLLGRETVISQSFFTSSQLLAEGLNDWSVEVGRVRRDLGISSANYGPSFASGTWRRGINSKFTLEGRVEATNEIKALGASSLVALPGQILGKAALVSSHTDKFGSGSQWLLGLERQDLNTNISFQAQQATLNFRQLGQELDILPTKQQVAGNFSYTTKNAGTLGLGFASISKYDQPRVDTVSGNYTLRVGKNSNLSFTASRALSNAAGNAGSAVGLSFVMPLDSNSGNTVISASVNHRSTGDDFYASASHNPVEDNGLGWRALAGQQQGQSRAEGGVIYLGRYGRVNGDLSSSPDQTALRVGTSGGLVIADGNFFATRRVDNSYGIAQVAGYANIDIGLGGSLLTKTDANGFALIPRMVPYQSNSVRIDPTALPISAEIDSIEQTVVPAYRSAVKVVFPVRSGRGALIKINFSDGQPAPAGALVYIDGDKQEFYVARRGEAFVTGLATTTSRLQLNWKNQSCKFEVTLPEISAIDIARVGPVVCQGVVR